MGRHRGPLRRLAARRIRTVSLSLVSRRTLASVAPYLIVGLRSCGGGAVTCTGPSRSAQNESIHAGGAPSARSATWIFPVRNTPSLGKQAHYTSPGTRRSPSAHGKPERPRRLRSLDEHPKPQSVPSVNSLRLCATLPVPTRRRSRYLPSYLAQTVSFARNAKTIPPPRRKPGSPRSVSGWVILSSEDPSHFDNPKGEDSVQTATRFSYTLGSHLRASASRTTAG